MRTFDTLGKKKIVIGMVHLVPLPGTPHFIEGNFEKALEKGVADARALETGGADGCLVQTVDRVYPLGDEADWARVAAFAAIVHEVMKATGPGFQVGVQIMWNALHASLGVAHAMGASFMRCAALIGVSDSPYGPIQGDPLKFLNYRNQLGNTNIKLIAEVDGMHYRSANGKPAVDLARMAMGVGADGVEIAHSDEEQNNRTVAEIKQKFPKLPVFLGGHTNHENAARRMKQADGAFVGSCLEKDGWGSSIDVDKVLEYVEIVRSIE
ncbi:MAG TPA: BtpA/SgcQ family protein [Anaerolineales bacterium]|nr:BtpA/SgcQ family protein [Anaerolineales bacterium]